MQSFYFLKLILNLTFFKITNNIKKKGIKMIICFTININGFKKWLEILKSDRPDLFNP